MQQARKDHSQYFGLKARAGMDEKAGTWDVPKTDLSRLPLEREEAKASRSERHDNGNGEQVWDGEPLMCAQVQFAQPHEKKRGRCQWADRKPHGHLAKCGSMCNFHGRPAVRLNYLPKYWHNAKVKRIRIEQEAQGHG